MASWDTPSTRRPISNCGLFSTAGSASHGKSPCTSRHIITKQTAAAANANCCSVWLWRGSWSWESSEQCSISVMRDYFIDAIDYFIDAICWHRAVHGDCVWLRLPELQSLFLCSGWFYPRNCILVTFSNDCGSALIEELCNHHGILLRRSLHQKGQVLSFVAFLSIRNQPVPKDKLNPCDNTLFSNCKESECTPFQCPRSKPWNFCNPSSTLILSCCFLHE